MYNASDRKDIRRAEKAEKVATSERVAFLKFAMSTPNGRSWFHSLLVSCHCFHVLPPTVPARVRAFADGERNIGIQIYADLTSHCPDLYLLMLHEAQTRELSNARSEPDLYDTTSRELPGSPTSNGGDPGPSSPGDYSADDDGGWGNLIGLGDE